MLAVEHQPFESDALGPWKKGKALGMTLGEWLAAEGRGSYQCKDGTGKVSVTFDNPTCLTFPSSRKRASSPTLSANGTCGSGACNW